MCYVEEAEAKATAGAPESGIEVTPEMIEAGYVAFCGERISFEYGTCSDLEAGLREIFRAMMAARRVV